MRANIDVINTGVKKFVMPVPWMNVINGGSHAGNRLAMQVSSSSFLSHHTSHPHSHPDSPSYCVPSAFPTGITRTQ